MRRHLRSLQARICADLPRLEKSTTVVLIYVNASPQPGWSPAPFVVSGEPDSGVLPPQVAYKAYSAGWAGSWVAAAAGYLRAVAASGLRVCAFTAVSSTGVVAGTSAAKLAPEGTR